MFASWFIRNQKNKTKNQEKQTGKRPLDIIRTYVIFEVYCFFFLEAGEAGRKE